MMEVDSPMISGVFLFLLGLLLPGFFPLGVIGILGVGFLTFVAVPSPDGPVAQPVAVEQSLHAQGEASPVLNAEEETESCHTP